jgi:hypothetical protein
MLTPLHHRYAQESHLMKGQSTTTDQAITRKSGQESQSVKDVETLVGFMEEFVRKNG